MSDFDSVGISPHPRKTEQSQTQNFGRLDEGKIPGEPTEVDIGREISETEEKLVDCIKRVAERVDLGGKKIPHEELFNLLNLTEQFYSGSQEVINYLLKETRTISEILRQVPGMAGVVGLGYPFYVIKLDGQPLKDIPEISSFLGLTKQLVQQDIELNKGGWLCPSCQRENNLPNLKTYCKPCRKVGLKPRDVFKALPDLDVVVIVDNPGKDTEEIVQEKLRDAGYTQSDIDIGNSVRQVERILTGLQEGKSPDEKVPIDIHIWSKSEVLALLEAVVQGETNLLIHGRSLHAEWEDNALNFLADFIFSFRDIELRDEELEAKIRLARKSIKERYSGKMDQLVDLLGGFSPRFKRLLSDGEVRQVLQGKIESW